MPIALSSLDNEMVMQISEERASQMLLELVQKRASAGVLQAAAMMRGGATDDAVDELIRVLKFASVLDVQAECKVSAAERSELFGIFQASRLATEVLGDDRPAQLELLKSVMGLAETAAA